MDVVNADIAGANICPYKSSSRRELHGLISDSFFIKKVVQISVLFKHRIIYSLMRHGAKLIKCQSQETGNHDSKIIKET